MSATPRRLGPILTLILCFQLAFGPYAFAQDQNSQYRADDPKSAGIFYFNQLNIMAYGAIGAGAIMGCTDKSYSIWSYIAGGVAYIAGEMIVGKEHNDVQKSRIQDLEIKKEKVETLQGEALQTARDAENERLKSTKKRRDFTTAMAVIQGISMGLAIVESICSIIKNTPYGAWCGAIDDTASCNGSDQKPSLIAKGLAVAWLAFMQADYGGLFGAKGEGSQTLQTIMSIAFPILAMTMWKITASAFNQAISRAVIMGVQFGITTGNAVHLSNAVKQLEKNVALLDELIAKYKENYETDPNSGVATGPAVMTPTATTTTVATTTEQPETSPTQTGKAPAGARYCTSRNSGDGTLSFGESSCKNSVKINPISFNSDFKYPILADGLNTAIDLSNASAAGDMEKAYANIGKLASMAVKVRDLNANLKKDLNKLMKDKGNKDWDFDKEMSKTQPQLLAAYNDAMKQANINSVPAAALAEKPKLDESENKAPEVKVPAAISLNANTSADLSSLTSTAEEISTDQGMSPEQVAQTMGQFDMGDNDIHKSKEQSLFDILSRRYLMSYPKVFRQKSQEPVPAQ